MLPVLKALGDETRFAMYQELSAATAALSTHELADRLELHPNTVRLHLERLRQAGLVEVEAVHRGTVGRPQHEYRLSADAPSLGLEPQSSTLLAGLMAALAERVGADADDAHAIGAAWGAEAAQRHRSTDCVRDVHSEMRRLGFEPHLETDGDRATIAFLACPFRDLAEAYPELVCNVHHGICSGVVDHAGGGTVESFSTLYDREACRLSVRRAHDPTASTVTSST